MTSSLDHDELPGLMELLREVVDRHGPELRPLLDRVGTHPLSRDEREALRGALADELVARGLDDDDEPNAYGLEIEAAIDRLGEL